MDNVTGMEMQVEILKVQRTELEKLRIGKRGAAALNIDARLGEIRRATKALNFKLNSKRTVSSIYDAMREVLTPEQFQQVSDRAKQLRGG